MVFNSFMQMPNEVQYGPLLSSATTDATSLGKVHILRSFYKINTTVSHVYIIKDYSNDKKVAAVLVVTKGREELTALKEAADLEKAFARYISHIT